MKLAWLWETLNVFVQIPFPKHLFTLRTPYGHIQTGFWRFQIFPVCRLPSTFVRWYPGPVGLRLLDPSGSRNVHTPCKSQRWVLLSPQAQDFLNRPQAQCTASRAACIHMCFQRCFEFQPSIIAADSSAPFLLRLCFCPLIRGEVENIRGRTVWIPRLQKFAANFLVLEPKIVFFWKKIPYVAIFYRLGWLVGWLWIGTTFREKRRNVVYWNPNGRSSMISF